MENNSTLEEAKKKRKQQRIIRTIKNLTITAAFISIAITIAFVTMLNTPSGKRFLKSLKSGYIEGMERTVTAYGPDGKIVGQWEGNIDIEENSYGNKVLFDLDGKRTAIYNAVVIAEEK